MICSKCGTENEKGVRLCAYCGNEFVSKNENQSVQNITLNNPQKKANQQKNNYLEKIKKIDKKKIAIVLAAILVIILLFKLFGSNKKTYENLLETESFFLSDSDGKYALFNESGKRLTNFEFDGSATFFNGTALVKNYEGKNALINEKGKFLVKYDDYSSLMKKGSLFLAIDSKYNVTLLNHKGKKIEKLDKAESLDLSNSSLITAIKYEKEYKFINYNGKEILDFKKAENESETPSISSYGIYSSIYYNGKTYVVDAYEGKKLLTFESKEKYCVDSVNEDNNELFVLKSCGRNSSNEKTFKVVKRKKVLYEKSSSKCSSISFSGDNVICNSKEGKFILDKKGSLTLNVNDDVSYIDEENYAKNSKDSTAVEIYKNGKLKKTIQCLKLTKEGYNESGIYLLGTTYDKKCETKYGIFQYFNDEGKVLNSEKYVSATMFDENDLAIVTTNYDDYYLINKKGEKVGNTYRRIGYAVGNYYVATIDNNIKVIINDKGKELVKAESIDIDEVKEDNYYAILKHSDDTYAVYDLKKKKEIIRLDSKPSLREHYFKTSKNDKVQYYSYKKGKLFHEA